jgi:LPXTG-site transpeptidase (sortase) family protein
VVPFAVPSTAISPTLKIAPTPTRSTAKPGVPIRLVIPSIDIDSSVQEIGTYWENGELLWETVPFVVGHYRTTAKAGDTGNAVFSGHVTSRSAGNVFRDLFRIRVGDEVHIYTEDARFVYVVTDVRLVLPTETSVMDPTEDATATLITCAGEWIQSEREYTHRLIVTTKLKR